MLSLCCFTVEISVYEIPGHAARFIGEPSHSPLPLRVTAQISQLCFCRDVALKLLKFG